MILDGLKYLYFDMKSKHLERYKFYFSYNRKEFSVFFFIDEIPFTLLFGAIGDNFSFELKVEKGFKINPYLENKTFLKLLKFLGIKQKDPSNPFKISSFFEEFNKKIPKQAYKKNVPQPEEIIKYRNNVEEADKIYFIGWRDNTLRNQQVSKENLEKTKKILGIRAYEICKNKNISSCWSDKPYKKVNFYLPKKIKK